MQSQLGVTTLSKLLKRRIEGWLLVGAEAQWQSTSMVSQMLYIGYFRLLAAPTLLLIVFVILKV